MPLIFSTYKLKLGGIVPTANLFSRFLEKDVEQAVNSYGFHAVQYAYWKYRAWEQRFLNANAQASSYVNSPAFPFWSEKGYAQHLNSQQEEFGDFSAIGKPVLFLPLWHRGVVEYPFANNNEVGDFKAQASWHDAHQFFTQYGYPEYELVFDRSHDVGVDWRFGQAHPFYAEKGFGWDLPNDLSYAFSTLGRPGAEAPFFSGMGEGWDLPNDMSYAFPADWRFGQADFYYSFINQAHTPEYDESRTGESLLSAERLAEIYFFELARAQHLQILHSEESSLGSYGTYDPFTPDKYLGSYLSAFHQREFNVNRFRQSNSIDFYMTWEDGYDYPFPVKALREESEFSSHYLFEKYWHYTLAAQQLKIKNTLESGAFKSAYAFESYWHDKYQAQQLKIKKAVESGTLSKMFAYERYWYDVMRAAKSNEYHKMVPEAIVSRVGNYPMFYQEKSRAEFAQAFKLKKMVELATSWKPRREASFYLNKNPGVVFPQNTFKKSTADADRTTNNDAFAEPSAHWNFNGSWDLTLTQEIAESYRASYGVPFYHYKNPGYDLEVLTYEYSSVNSLRKAEPFWYDTYGSYSYKHKATGIATSSRQAYYDIRFEAVYQGTNWKGGNSKVPESVLKSMRNEASFYYYIKPGSVSHRMLGSIATKLTSEIFVSPWMSLTRTATTYNGKSPELSESFSYNPPVSVIVALYKFNGYHAMEIKGEEKADADHVAAVVTPYMPVMRMGVTLQIIPKAALAIATGNSPADPQPYYVRQFTSNINADLTPNISERYLNVAVIQPYMPRQFEGLRKKEQFEVLQDQFVLGTSYEIMRALELYPTRTNYAVNSIRIKFAELSMATGVPSIAPVILKSNGSGDKPLSFQAFNGAQLYDIPYEREYWDMLPITYYAHEFFQFWKGFSTNGRSDASSFMISILRSYDSFNMYPKPMNHRQWANSWAYQIWPWINTAYVNEAKNLSQLTHQFGPNTRVVADAHLFSVALSKNDGIQQSPKMAVFFEEDLA